MKVLGHMEKTVGAFEVRRKFGELLDEVTQGDKVVVERHGKAVAAVVPIELYEQWKRQRQHFFDTVREISGRVDLSEDEAMELALEAQQAVRVGK
jgi:prevent-host-death family protein